ncbi:MAG: hypothetical protein CMH30_09485 [Micavibrio sp.]|nr:hypothetical protein [Micavibrio sp.]
MIDISIDGLKNTVDGIEARRAHVFKYFIFKVSLCGFFTLLAMATMFFLLTMNGGSWLGLDQTATLIILVLSALIVLLMQFLTHKIYKKAQKFRQGEARNQIITALLAGTGLSLNVTDQSQLLQQALIKKANALLPNAPIIECSDYICVENMEMVNFRLIDRQVETVQRGNTRHTRIDHYVLFQGFIMCIQIKEIPQEMLILKDAGLMNGIRGAFSKMERISLEDPVFESLFEVYSLDQLESRKVLSPKVMEHMVELYHLAQGFRDLKPPYRHSETYDGHRVLKSRLQNAPLQMHFQKNQLILTCGLEQPLWRMPPIYRKWGADKWINYIQAQSLAFQAFYQKAINLR